MTTTAAVEPVRHAAALLFEAARTGPVGDTESRLRCLMAVDALTKVGATVPRPPVDGRRSRQELIAAALHLLAQLSIDVFDRDEILDACAHARRALRTAI